MNKSDKPSVYRKRYIPDEIKSLEKDEILYMSDDVIVTKWDTFRPKKNFSNGISCTFVNKGFKISKFMDNNGKLVYYYCDIIHSDYYKDENKWIFTDLLADVKIYPDGRTEIIDLDEVSEALKSGIISTETVCELMENLNSLLGIIYSGEWRKMTERFFV
ncbi:DUF402 domain-containing protein [Anaerotignum sp. MSJ-24]|uniref:DUF402 domain-containing protein n=1 Tax=Anaerotignum sp. MSJ-24 TaxID=2841521 RepID=UPI001C10660D|nr:DUF402 domain-containing protein [Anaerotignum sp. MSJ-24]MBU5463513.1 DUF402 domain-containing protein [Anaerotignum sp. MSJ-24]